MSDPLKLETGSVSDLEIETGTCYRTRDGRVARVVFVGSYRCKVEISGVLQWLDQTDLVCEACEAAEVVQKKKSVREQVNEAMDEFIEEQRLVLTPAEHKAMFGAFTKKTDHAAEDHTEILSYARELETSRHRESNIADASHELCCALAERWFEPGDTEAQTARCVAAHRVVTDLLLEGGGK